MSKKHKGYNEYNEYMSSDGSVFRERNGEIYSGYDLYPIKYKKIISIANDEFTSLYSPKDFFDIEIKELIDKIDINALTKNDYKEIIEETIPKELQVALLQSKHTPKDIVLEIAKRQSNSIKRYILARNDLDEEILKEAFKDIHIPELIAIFNQYIGKQNDLPLSQNAISYCANKLSKELLYRPFAFLKDKEFLLKQIETTSDDKQHIATNIAGNTSLSDGLREDIFSNPENECDIYSVANKTEKMKEDVYDSLMDTLDIENNEKNPDIEDAQRLALNHLISAIENHNLTSSLQKDLVYRLQSKDWNSDRYFMLMNTMARYFDDSTAINLMFLMFDDKVKDSRLEPLSKNRYMDSKTLYRRLYVLIEKAIETKMTDDFKYYKSQIIESLPHIAITKAIADELLKINDFDINLNIIKHQSAPYDIINKFMTSPNEQLKFFAQIASDIKLSGLMKKRLFETFEKPQEEISISLDGLKRTMHYNVEIVTKGLQPQDIKTIKDFLNIQKSFMKSDIILDMICNYLVKIDIDYQHQNALFKLGLEYRYGKIEFIDNEKPIIINQSKEFISNNIKLLPIDDIDAIKRLLSLHYFSLHTFDDSIRFYKEIDAYKDLFDAIENGINQKEKDIDKKEIEFNL